MGKRIDITGNKYGMLTVVKFSHTDKNRQSVWKCKCDCGNECEVGGASLKSGNTRSCGCIQKKRRNTFAEKYAGQIVKENDLKGMRFGRLTVESRAEDIVYKNGTHVRAWNCICDCGNKKKVSGSLLVSGNTKSCGCSRKETHIIIHGLSKTRLYNEWRGMIYRCKTPKYERYQGRGIKVCDEWKGHEGLRKFCEWATKNGYKDNLTIDRIDNDGDYEPSNCRWVDAYAQMNNTSWTVKLSVDGETKGISEWARISGINRRTISRRLERGWDVKRAIFEPSHYRRANNEVEGMPVLRERASNEISNIRIYENQAVHAPL